MPNIAPPSFGLTRPLPPKSTTTSHFSGQTVSWMGQPQLANSDILCLKYANPTHPQFSAEEEMSVAKNNQSQIENLPEHDTSSSKLTFGMAPREKKEPKKKTHRVGSPFKQVENSHESLGYTTLYGKFVKTRMRDKTGQPTSISPHPSDSETTKREKRKEAKRARSRSENMTEEQHGKDLARKQRSGMTEEQKRSRDNSIRKYNQKPQAKEFNKNYHRDYQKSGEKAWTFIKDKPDLLNFIKNDSMTDAQCLEALKNTLNKPPYNTTFSDALLKKVIQTVRKSDADDSSCSSSEESSASDSGGVASKKQKTTSGGDSESTDTRTSRAVNALSLQKQKRFSEKELIVYLHNFLAKKEGVTTPLPPKADPGINKEAFYSLLAQLQRSTRSHHLTSPQRQLNERAYQVLGKALDELYGSNPMSAATQSYLAPSSNTPARTTTVSSQHTPITSGRPTITQKRQQEILNDFNKYRNTDQPFLRDVTLSELEAVATQLAKQTQNAKKGSTLEKINEDFKREFKKWKEKNEPPTITYQQPRIPLSNTVDPSQIQITSTDYKVTAARTTSYRAPQYTTTSQPTSSSQTASSGLPAGARPIGDRRSSNLHVLSPRYDLQDYTFHPGGPIHTYQLIGDTWVEYVELIQTSSRR
jgi:hypothetical protein